MAGQKGQAVNVLHLPRAAGKTLRLIGMAHKSRGILVTFNDAEKARLRREYSKLLEPWQVLSVNDLLSGNYFADQHRDAALFVDNVDYILEQLFSRKVDTVSATYG